MARSGRASDSRARCETCGKQCLTRDEAHHAARFLNSHQQNDAHPVHAFRCGSWWHTGHVPGAKLNIRAKRKQRVGGPGPRPLTPHSQLPPELQ